MTEDMHNWQTINSVCSQRCLFWVCEGTAASSR